jgi:putative PIN family toxin of toxin-antitoxin system
MLTPKGNPAKIVNLFVSGILAVATSNEVIAEYERVLAYEKFRRSQAVSQALLSPFLRSRPKVVPLRRLAVCDDPSDNQSLECAEAAGANFLIPGNLRHFPRLHYDTVVLSPAEFVSTQSGMTVVP